MWYKLACRKAELSTHSGHAQIGAGIVQERTLATQARSS